MFCYCQKKKNKYPSRVLILGTNSGFILPQLGITKNDNYKVDFILPPTTHSIN